MILIAADDAVAESAAAALGDRELARATTLSAVRERLDDAAVVVAADLADADAASVVAAVRRSAPETPVVALDPDVDADETADVDDLAAAVDRVEGVREYRAAVDDLYERARAAADGEDVDLEAALEHADELYHRVREETDESPYEALLDE